METIDISSIKEDPNNANLHTDRGDDLLDYSLTTFGFIEAGVLDQDNTLIGGHKRTEVATRHGATDARIIDHDPNDGPIYLRLKGFDLDSPDPNIRRKTNEASIMLNRAPQQSINLSPTIMQRNAEAFDFDLFTYYTNEEFEHLQLQWSDELDTSEDEEWLESFDSPGSSSIINYRVVVDGLELDAAQEIAASIPSARVEQYREKTQ